MEKSDFRPLAAVVRSETFTFAVRSSATAEDLPDASFAGDSPLNDSLSGKSAVGLDVSRLIRVDSLTNLHDDVDWRIPSQ